VDNTPNVSAGDNLASPRELSDDHSSEDKRPIRRALISVSDKTGVAELGRGLYDAGVEIISTGSTAAHLRQAGVSVTLVEEVTGFPECLDGRVKTLHPRIHAAILADMDNPEHRATLHDDLGLTPFELVVVNLYPFRETVAAGASTAVCVEQIDIGGPALIRAAAKNHDSVAVVVSPDRYGDVLTALAESGFSLDQRRRLAAEAFAHVASYDMAVASWLGNVLTSEPDGTGFPAWLGATWERAALLRYGENPHQRAALYASRDTSVGLAQAEQLHGKQMSYNNYVDTEAACRAAYDFAEPCVAIIKHANPCGIAIGKDVAEAHRSAHACDPVSAFGGVIAVNRPVTLAMAEQVAEIFTEVVAAPEFDPGVVELLAGKKNLRLLRCPHPSSTSAAEWRQISGGLLVQSVDRLDAPGDDPAAWSLAAGDLAENSTLADLVFAWRAVRAVKSNAILLAAQGATVGIGMGQVNRVDSARLAVSRAGDRAAGSVAASDAFFPFPDGLHVLIDAGVRAVVQPGGSLRDQDVITAAATAGITLYLTGVRHFFH